MRSSDCTRLFWALLASGQINMRKVDGWQTLATKPRSLKRYLHVTGVRATPNSNQTSGGILATARQLALPYRQ
jgi:hypothetical protein